MGGEITWECMGNGTYIFSMKLYRDCNGWDDPSLVGPINMEVHNHATITGISMNLTARNDISPQCTGGGPSITCVGGGNGAVEEFVYNSAPITISGTPPAQGWVFTYDNFARNGAITNLVSPSSRGFTLRAKMFAYSGLNTSPCFDSSPSFSTKPSTIVCAGVPFTYNQLAFDKDGDSLVYSWAQPLDDFSGAFTSTNPVAIPFSGTYTFNSPYPNTTHNASNVPATLDANTGEINFTSFTQGNFVNCIKVSSYKCGVLVAEVFREIQVIILSCPANAPPTTNFPFLDPSGNPSFNDTVIAGELINFKYCGYDTPGQLITMTVIGDQFGTNYANPNAGCQNPPCAILGPPPLPSISGFDSVCIFFQWQTACSHLQSSGGCAATSSTYQFLFTIQDDACPTAGLNIGTVSITIIPPEPIESPEIHCVSVIPNGDVILTWDTPIDTVSGFNDYEIFHSSNPTGPFTSIATIGNYNQTTYTHIGANGNSAPQYYYIQSLGCAEGTAAAVIDTASSIFLTATATGNIATLNWNPIYNPLLSSSSTWYRVYREQPIGTWTLIDSTQSLTYVDTLNLCDSLISYRVEIDDNLPCTSMSSIDTVSISGGAANLADFSFIGTCIGDSIYFTFINLSGNVIPNYYWDFGDGDTSNLVNPVHFYGSAGNFTVSLNVSTSSNCQDSVSQVVTINPIPTLTVSPDTIICQNTAVQLNGTGGNSYLWSPGGSLNDDTINNPIANPTSTTNYILLVTDTNGCQNTDSVLVSLFTIPIFTAGNDTAICLNDSVQLNASGGLTYSWTPNISLSNDTIANPWAFPTVTTTYIATIMDSNLCSYVDSVTITINPLPILVTTDTAICINDTVQIFVSGASQYLWTPSSTLNDSTVFNPLAFPLTTTTYSVNGIDTNGCSNTETLTVTVNPLPIVDAGLDTTVCNGTSLTLGGNPTGSFGSSYNWSPSASLNDDTLANPIATPTINPTEYIVTVTDTNGCINMDSVLISINPLPVIITNNDTSVCIGTCAQLNASGAISYSWSPGNELSDSTIANPVACLSNTTTFIVTGTDINGCIDTASVIITINPSPIVNAGNDTVICVGTSTILGGAPTGSNGSIYSWTPATTLNDSTIANPTATPLATTTYFLTVTDTNGCIDMDTVTITINPLPIVDAGLDTSICIGDSIQVNATGAASYQWTPNTTINNNGISNPIVFPTTTTTYFVIGTDTNGCINIDSVIIIVNMLPTIIINNDTTVCVGTCAQLITSGGISYTWSPGSSLSDSIIPNPIACPIIATTYMVTVTDSNTCVDTSSVTISINPLPIIDAGPDLWICSGDSIQLSVTGGISYLWTPFLGLNDTTISNPMANPTDTAIYLVTGTDINGCEYTDTLQIIVNDEVPIDPGMNDTICAGDSIMLGGVPTSPNGTSFLWFPNGGTLDNDTLANPIAFPLITTTYYIVATNDTCTAIDSITITVNQLPNIAAGGDIDICFGDSVQLNASGGLNYIWQPGGLLNDSTLSNPIGIPTDTTQFIVFGTDTNGCSAYDSIVVNVNPLPIIIASSSSPNVCLNDTVQLNASGGISYLWTPSIGLSDTTIANPLAFPINGTTYIVTGTDANMCSNTDSVTINVNQLNIVDLTDTVICIGEALQLEVIGPSGSSYNWSPLTDLSNPNIYNPITTTQVTILYLVTVTDTNGCADTTSILVTAEPKPISDFTIDATPSCDGILVEFTNLSTGAVSYLWNFNDGAQSDEIHPIHLFQYTFSTTVILTSYSQGLCIDTISYPITSGKFEDYFNLTPPTILTPNNDGINDVFRLDLPEEISECTSILVFNRWGKKVYDSKNHSNGWNGRTTLGKMVPDGTYFYIIDINGITKKGSITLMK
ncbi:MAG: hypothetical protein COA97_00865 [Flavobacteriales bacterium]|nr:MAG: hypothetical protein COA97_00865 [Flavobacteriales bacterium]